MPVPAGLPQNPTDYIQILKRRCDEAKYNGAVCDMLGRMYQNSKGQMVKVTEQTHPFYRYELRSRQHVKVYMFDVIYANYNEATT
ncbi:hypothetical protein P67b_00029 [Ruegeria phage Tedan]|nr:hypothetical protein P67b_00029 [Ruegeria phage Tedan]